MGILKSDMWPPAWHIALATGAAQSSRKLGFSGVYLSVETVEALLEMAQNGPRAQEGSEVDGPLPSGEARD